MKELKTMLSPYQKSDDRYSGLQMGSTLFLYILLWILMALSLQVSYLLTLALSIIAAGFLVRIFIFFHDCGHNSFFSSLPANKIAGFFLGVLVFTPSLQWWHCHAIHHASSGNLDKRGIGDVDTMTVSEFRNSTPIKRAWYRFFRHPFTLLVLGPFFSFIVLQRLPLPPFGKKENLNVLWTNLAIVVLAAGISLVIGFKAYLMIQLPVMLIAGAAGIWLFYVQHQFVGVYWARKKDWDYISSALLGASYYKLPRVLQYISGSIGFHQIHHLSPRIPNYRLAAAYHDNPVIQEWSHAVGLWESLHCARLKLWDEDKQQLVGFNNLQA